MIEEAHRLSIPRGRGRRGRAGGPKCPAGPSIFRGRARKNPGLPGRRRCIISGSVWAVSQGPAGPISRAALRGGARRADLLAATWGRQNSLTCAFARRRRRRRAAAIADFREGLAEDGGNGPPRPAAESTCGFMRGGGRTLGADREVLSSRVLRGMCAIAIN